MKGSIALSQDPVIDFDYRVNGAETMRVLVSDSEGASWERTSRSAGQLGEAKVARSASAWSEGASWRSASSVAGSVSGR